MNKIFERVKGLKPGRSYFDLSHPVMFDTYAGRLIPILCEEMVPGDYFQISNEVIVRLQPLVAPILHSISIKVHYFFVPYRLLWDLWELFITGGPDGQDDSVLPRWTPDSILKGSLWDHLGFPLVIPTGLSRPLSFPLRAYKFIWNEFYRDENLQTEEDITDDTVSSVKNVSWSKDYFTSALPWQQRGIAPAFPIQGYANTYFEDDLINEVLSYNLSADPVSDLTKAGGGNIGHEQALLADLGNAVTFNISDVRLAAQTQKFLERNARHGVRYTEFLQAHYGVNPRDDRLQRPEYIGGSKQPIIISEVLKTSEDGDNPQGTMAGHGLSASMAKAASYHAKEFGLVMGLMSIVPDTVYNSQGFDRQWLRRDKLDFYFPEFAHLSEQAIEREEVYATNVEADNREVWGWQGRHDEMRFKRGKVAGNFRDTLNYWHMARTFSSAPALNDAFLQIDGTDAGNLARVFAVQNEPGYLVHFGNIIKASRPIPIASEPGLLDHF